MRLLGGVLGELSVVLRGRVRRWMRLLGGVLGELSVELRGRVRRWMRLLLGGVLGELLAARLERWVNDKTLTSHGVQTGSAPIIQLGPPASLGSCSRPSATPTGIFIESDGSESEKSTRMPVGPT